MDARAPKLGDVAAIAGIELARSHLRRERGKIGDVDSPEQELDAFSKLLGDLHQRGPDELKLARPKAAPHVAYPDRRALRRRHDTIGKIFDRDTTGMRNDPRIVRLDALRDVIAGDPD